jgi:hypothetical protein
VMRSGPLCVLLIAAPGSFAHLHLARLARAGLLNPFRRLTLALFCLTGYQRDRSRAYALNTGLSMVSLQGRAYAESTQGAADRSLAARLAISPAKSRQLCRHTDVRPRRRGRHIGVYLADFFDVFVE